MIMMSVMHGCDDDSDDDEVSDDTDGIVVMEMVVMNFHGGYELSEPT